MIELFISVMITVAWITYGPIIKFKRLFLKEEESYGGIKAFFQELIYCALCSGVWIGSIILYIKANTTLLYISLVILSSILSELITKKLNN